MRAGEKTQVGIANIEPDFLQVEVTTGQASIDVRELDAGHTIEVGTPNAAFTIEHTGYYRVNVNGDTTTFITRRSGRALVTPEGGRAGAISPSEQVVVQGQSNPTVETYVAPDLDDWDRWNYARTDRLLDSMSARYVSPGVAGTADLDHYGSWRVVPTYGPVWIPRGVTRGWAPYSNGRWIMDPYYGWTWIDYAPWGWAPYHYGRWVYLDSYWGWAPGPVGIRTAYAPALVAFFGDDDWSIGSPASADPPLAGSRSAGESRATRGGDLRGTATVRGGADGTATTTGTTSITITITTVITTTRRFPW